MSGRGLASPTFDFRGDDPGARGVLRRMAREQKLDIGAVRLSLEGAIARRVPGRYSELARDPDGVVRARLYGEPLTSRRAIDAAELRNRMPLCVGEALDDAGWAEVARLVDAAYPAPEPATPEPAAPGTSWLRGKTTRP